VSAIGNLAASFLQTFGLGAFGRWQRGTRAGMENGLFAYDESTAELLDVEEAEVTDAGNEALA
jgi:hypothetical protein